MRECNLQRARKRETRERKKGMQGRRCEIRRMEAKLQPKIKEEREQRRERERGR